MEVYPQRPLVIQKDRTIFLEVRHAQFEEVRKQVHTFAELVKNPGSIHTYRLTRFSLWNAAAGGIGAEEIIRCLAQYAKFPVPGEVERSIREDMNNYGRLYLKQVDEQLYLCAQQEEYIRNLLHYPSFQSFFIGKPDQASINYRSVWMIRVASNMRGKLKQECIRLGYPVKDEAGYRQGDPLSLSWRSVLADGRPFQLREYQVEAADAFYQEGSLFGGNGVVVLPCGAGKTIIGLASIIHVQSATLILTVNMTSVQQWKQELLDKTNLAEDQVGIYTSNEKQIRPITIATYNILTYREGNTDNFSHMHLFQERNWGLIIYDEVHLLPAPVFRSTATIQSTRRLGLTATLVREDGREEDVFSLIGPKRYDLPWKRLEGSGHIATAYCTQIQVDFDDQRKEQYYLASARSQIRIAQENPRKIDVVRRLLQKHKGLPTLIIGQYVQQLEEIGRLLGFPVITGKMKQKERELLYQQFKQGERLVLVVSKVANFAIDLPDASVAIQVSGTYGSRQEEAQRLGRILRPKEKENRAYFYHIVTRDSKDQEYARQRQLFLSEQGYHYQEWQGLEEIT